MSRTPTMRARLQEGQSLVGSFLNLGSALAAEACAVAGLDWVLVDLEHGGGHEAELAGQLQAAQGAGAHALVRVESLERARAGRPLDLGAEGIMFPRVESAEAARTAIAHLRYPPAGDRGVATYNRACGFGTRPEAIADADAHITGIVQIESPAAVSEAAAIAQVDGVDVLFVGPGDLSHAMGRFGALDDPEVRAAFRTVVESAEAAGKAAGILVPGPERVAAARADGFRFIGVGSDSTLLCQAARRAAQALE
jgi:2-keto-3-deoxy-L-rhamnonate aldolase RhmA